jgi:hypothetical protein
MSAQIPRPIGIIGFAFTLLVGCLAMSLPDHAAGADDCLKAPSSPAPAKAHWYYRTDRAQQRQCWYLRAANDTSQLATVPNAPVTAIAASSHSATSSPYSLASFKDFMAQRGGAKLSDQEVEKLYAEFLEWKRGAKN